MATLVADKATVCELCKPEISCYLQNQYTW